MKATVVNINAVPKLNLKNLLKSLCVALIISIILIAILSLLLVFTPLPESTTGFAIILVIILSNLLAGINLSKKMRANGMVAGSVSGIFYAVALYLIGAIFYNKVDINLGTLGMLLLSLISGAIGGIIGVNSK